MSVPGSGAPVRPSVTYPRTEWDRGGRVRARDGVAGPPTVRGRRGRGVAGRVRHDLRITGLDLDRVGPGAVRRGGWELDSTAAGGDRRPRKGGRGVRVADGPVDPRVHRVRVQGEVVPLDLARVDREGIVAE